MKADLKQDSLPGIEPPAKKVNRHVVIAANHMNRRREILLEKRAEINREIEQLDTAILALG